MRSVRSISCTCSSTVSWFSNTSDMCAPSCTRLRFLSAITRSRKRSRTCSYGPSASSSDRSTGFMFPALLTRMGWPRPRRARLPPCVRAASRPASETPRRAPSLESVERLLETAGVRLLGLRQRLEPLGDVLEAFFARGLGHRRIHLGVLVGLAGHRGREVQVGRADRLAARRIAHLL